MITAASRSYDFHSPGSKSANKIHHHPIYKIYNTSFWIISFKKISALWNKEYQQVPKSVSTVHPVTKTIHEKVEKPLGLWNNMTWKKNRETRNEE
jgi:hypothetical protein